MIFITPKLDEIYLKEEQEFNFSKLINEKSFTKSDTPFSYRQINTLSKDRLFPEGRTNKKGWRKFSLKELIYFSLIYELKKFGLTHDFLKNLSDSFFNEQTSEIAIVCVLIRAEMMLTIRTDGKATYYDPPHYLLIGREETPTIQIRLNDIVNAVNEKIKKSSIPIKWSGRNYLWNRESSVVSDKEREVLKILRNRAYSTVKLKTKDGKVSLVHMGKIVDPKLSMQELEKSMKANAYQEIAIILENGKIVSYKADEKIKV